MEDDGSRSRLASASAAASRVARRRSAEPARPRGRRRRRVGGVDVAASSPLRLVVVGNVAVGADVGALRAGEDRASSARGTGEARGARRATMERGARVARGASSGGTPRAGGARGGRALARASNAPMANIARVVCADGRRIARGWWSASRRARRGGHVRRLSRFRTATDEIFLRRVGTARRRGRISRRRTCASDQQRRAAIEIDRDRSSAGEHDVRARAGKCPRPTRVPSG